MNQYPHIRVFIDNGGGACLKYTKGWYNLPKDIKLDALCSILDEIRLMYESELYI